jgi:exopolyphosphatase/pppGpp-phosphohydrolase
MVEGREDVIVGGTLVLAAIMDVFRCDECLVSESDILDGLAASLCV